MQCPNCFFHISAFWIFLRTAEKECHCEPVLTLAWPLPGIPSGHNPFPPWLPLWGSCHEVTERVNSPSPPHSGHLSHRERQDPHPSRACGRRASHLSHRGRFGRTDCHTSVATLVRNDMRFWVVLKKSNATSSGSSSHLYTVEQLPLAIDLNSLRGAPPLISKGSLFAFCRKFPETAKKAGGQWPPLQGFQNFY